MPNPISDPFTVAVVMATGAVVVGGVWVATAVAVVVSRTIEHHIRMKRATR